MADSGWGNAFDAGEPLRNYETVLVPRFFGPWASVLLDELEPAAGESVIDIACGPGTVTRVAAARVGASGRVVGCDLNSAMLGLASEKPAESGAAPIEYLECSADALPLPGDDFEVVTCQHGLQFFADRPGALAEMRRVGKAGARVGIAVWTSIEEAPVFAAVARAIGTLLGDATANLFRGGPWGLNDAGQLLGYVEAAGFTNARVVHRTLPIVFEGGVEQLARTLTFSPVAAPIEALGPGSYNAVCDALAAETASLTVAGEIRSQASAHLAIAEG